MPDITVVKSGDSAIEILRKGQDCLEKNWVENNQSQLILVNLCKKVGVLVGRDLDTCFNQSNVGGGR